MPSFKYIIVVVSAILLTRLPPSVLGASHHLAPPNSDALRPEVLTGAYSPCSVATLPKVRAIRYTLGEYEVEFKELIDDELQPPCPGMLQYCDQSQALLWPELDMNWSVANWREVKLIGHDGCHFGNTDTCSDPHWYTHARGIAFWSFD